MIVFKLRKFLSFLTAFTVILSTVAIPSVQAGVPTLSGGGPIDGQTNVPLEAFMDVTANEPLNPASVTTSTVTLYSCTGETNASACATPVTATNLCSSINLENSNAHIVCMHSPLLINTTYRFQVLGGDTGIQSVSTSDRMASNLTRIFRTGSVDFNTVTTMPQVVSSIPSAFSGVATNTPLVFNFSFGPESSMLADNTMNAVNNTGNIRLRTVTNGVFGSDTCTEGSCGTIAYLDGSHTLMVSGLTLSASTGYEACLLGNVRNTGGQALGSDYCFGFMTGASADSAGPSAASVVFDPVNGATGVSRFLDYLVVDFPESLNISTAILSNIGLYIDADASSTFNDPDSELGSGSLSISFDPTGRYIDLGLVQPLSATTRYCYKVTTGVQDIVGNALSSAIQNVCFTTGSVSDSTGPNVMYTDADTFGMVVAFNEALNQPSATTPANYTLECGEDGVNFTQVSLTGKVLTYFSDRREVGFQGLGLTPNQQCRLTASTSILDLAGNAMRTAGGVNIALFMVLDSAETGGFLGGGGMTQDFQNSTNFSTFWENPEFCEPETRVTSVSTAVRCEFPSPAILPLGSTFTLTFPSGFDVTSAQAKPNAFDNNDLNGPSANTPVIASVVADVTTRTVVVTTGASTIANNDRVRFVLNGVTTPSTEQMDKRISIVVKNALGVKQGQTINPSPFNIVAGGSRSVSGTVYKDSDADETVDGGEGLSGVMVFCDQFGSFGDDGGFVGHQETTTNGSGVWTVTGLFDGSYGCGVPPLDRGNVSYENLSGGQNFRDVNVNGGNVTGVDFKFTDLETDVTVQTLTVNVSGMNDADSNVDADVFCHAGNFDFEFSAPTMKAFDYATTGATTVTVKLKGGKTYECGVGPHMDFSNFTGGPPSVPDFDFMPPPPQQVVVPSGSTPSAITFALESTDFTISGTVRDGSTNGIANVYVNAFPLGCFDTTTGAYKACNGGFAQSKADGTFTLNISAGVYEVCAFAPGMPESECENVTVTDVNVSDVILKISTSSGQVVDDSGNGIQYAGVDAEKVTAGDTCTSFTPKGGFTNSPTDASGNYTLYVADGTWNVRAFAPAYGQVGCTTVVVSGSSESGKNIQASSASFKTISGTCLDGAFVSAFGANGGNQGQCTGGAYSLKVSAGSGYTVECFAHGKGPCGRQTGVDTSSLDQTINFATSVATGTVAVTITGITDAFVNIRDSGGQGAGTGTNTSGVYTLNLVAGTYNVKGGSPKYGELCSGQSVTVTADVTSAVTCTPPANLRSITGNVTDGSSNLAGVTVTLTDTTGKIFNTKSGNQSGESNNLSLLNVPDGTYKLRASKKGYESETTTATVSGGNLDITAPIALTQASGAGGDTVTVTVRDNTDTAYTSNARVVATSGSGSSQTTVIAQTDKTTGQASLDLGNGTWTIEAVGDNGNESSTTTVVVTSGTANTPSFNADLDTAVSGFTSGKDSSSFIPSTGGVIKGTNIPGLEINVPGSTFSTTDTSTATMSIKKDPTIAGIDPGADQNFVGSSGFAITPSDSNNKEMSSLTGSVTITVPYTDAEVLAAGVDESKLVFAAIDANGEWESFPTTVDAVNNTLTAQVTHFSTFGIVGGLTTSSSSGGGGGGGGTSGSVNTPTVIANVLVGAGGVITGGSVSSVSWSITGSSTSVDVALSKDDGATYTTIASGTPSGSSYLWQVPNESVARAKIRVSVRNGGAVLDSEVSSVFAIQGSTGVIVTAPVEATQASVVQISDPVSSLYPSRASVEATLPTGIGIGNLVKRADLSTIYYVGADGKRHPFSDEKAFFSWFDNFDGVSVVSAETLSAMTVGRSVRVRPGTWLIKIQSDPKVYAVEPGGTRRWITSEAVAVELYGSEWNKKIIDVSPAFFSGYPEGDSIVGGSVHPKGSLVQNVTGDIFYVSESGTLRPFGSLIARQANGLQERFLQTATTADLALLEGATVENEEDVLYVYQDIGR